MKTLTRSFAVLTATALVAATAVAGGSYHKAAAKDIVDTAVSAGSFTTLVTAVQAAGLVDTLKGDGPFTVFAPTDEAFAALPAGTLENLLKPENRESLRAVLLYHVVSGKVMSTQAASLNEATAVSGAELPITRSGSGLMVAGANVVSPDIEASNGVIHVIDAVMLPPTK